MNSTAQFDTDKAYAEYMRDTYLVPHFYEKYAHKGRYVFIDKSKCSMALQTQWGVDTVIQRKDGSSIFIEEKVERWPGYERPNFFLETHSVNRNGDIKECWMLYCQADYLLYAFEQERGGILIYWIPFKPLQEWFHLHRGKYQTRQVNRTFGTLVPIRDVLRALPIIKQYHIPASGGCEYVGKTA